MRPCTPHYVLGVKPTITHGRHFYSSSTITDTCAGIIHSFVMASRVTNEDHTSTRTLLRRLLIMWIDYYCDGRSNSGVCSAFVLISFSRLTWRMLQRRLSPRATSLTFVCLLDSLTLPWSVRS